MTSQFVVRKIHKWVGLIVAIQLFFWVFSGLIMSILPIEQVHGDHKRHPAEYDAINSASVIPLETLFSNIAYPVESVTLENSERGLLYKVNVLNGRDLYYDPVTGESLSTLEKKQAEFIAAKRYRGFAKIQSTDWLDKHTQEYKGPIPVWKVQFGDRTLTTFYIHPYSGDLTTVRNIQWRVFDFVWMLHIMDYENREDFNHPLLIVFATTTLMFCITGIMLLFQSQYRRDFKKALSFFSKNRADD